MCLRCLAAFIKKRAVIKSIVSSRIYQHRWNRHDANLSQKRVCCECLFTEDTFFFPTFFLWAIKDQSQGGGTCLWHRKNDNQLRIHIKCARNICFRIPPKISFLTYTAAGVVRRCEGRSSPRSCLGGGAFVKRCFFACRFQAHVKIVRFDRHLGRQIILVMMTFAILHFSN